MMDGDAVKQLYTALAFASFVNNGHREHITQLLESQTSIPGSLEDSSNTGVCKDAFNDADTYQRSI